VREPVLDLTTPAELGLCQEVEESPPESGLLSKLLLTLHMAIEPSLSPLKMWFELTAMPLMGELCAFISPTSAQVSADQSLMKPARQPETSVVAPGRNERPQIQSCKRSIVSLVTSHKKHNSDTWI
jgi:hypothetical protein